MPVNIRFLNAHHGDSILITIESGKETIRILVDGGPPYTFKPRRRGDVRDGDLKRVLDDLRSKRQKIDLVILTHVDDDHIGGLIKAFESRDALPKIANKVIFNSGRLIHEYFNEPIVPEKDIKGNFTQVQGTSIAQGNTLEKFLVSKGVWHRELVRQGSVYKLANCKLTFLGPNEGELKKLLGKWEKDQKNQFTSAARTDWSESYESLLSKDVFREDDSKTNASSLSFILTVGESNFLFLGDAHPSTVVEGLTALGYTQSKPLKVEVFKVSHHGSKGNTSYELLKLVTSPKYIISTDGSRHGLPDKVTLARIHNTISSAKIYFNYKAVIDKIYTKEELLKLRDKVQVLVEELKFA